MLIKKNIKGLENIESFSLQFKGPTDWSENQYYYIPYEVWKYLYKKMGNNFSTHPVFFENTLEESGFYDEENMDFKFNYGDFDSEFFYALPENFEVFELLDIDCQFTKNNDLNEAEKERISSEILQYFKELNKSERLLNKLNFRENKSETEVLDCSRGPFKNPDKNYILISEFVSFFSESDDGTIELNFDNLQKDLDQVFEDNSIEYFFENDGIRTKKYINDYQSFMFITPSEEWNTDNGYYNVFTESYYYSTLLDEFNFSTEKLISVAESDRTLEKKLFNRSVEVQEIDQAQFIPNILEGKQIVITGTLKHFTRQTIKDTIIKLGGKVQSSITANTDYVIKGFENTGSKLDKAKEKNILIKDEEAFLKEITQIKTDENKSENNDIKDRLKKLKELLEEDLITEDEYNEKRQQILKEL